MMNENTDFVTPSRSVLVPPSMARVTQDVELYRIIADERLRADKHRLNFQEIKVEHNRVQEEFKCLQIQNKRLMETSEKAKEEARLTINQLRRDVEDKQDQIEQLKIKSQISPQDLDLLRTELLNEMEQPLRERLGFVEEEAEQVRADNSRLRYELAFLKSELEHFIMEHKRLSEELKLKYNAELNTLRAEHKSVGEPLGSRDSGNDVLQFRLLKREHAASQQQCRALVAEVEELLAQKDHRGIQTEIIQRAQAKQLVEHSAVVHALELEKASLHAQMAHIQRELAQAGEAQIELTSQLHLKQAEASDLRGKLQDGEYHARRDAAEVKVLLARQRGDIERDRDRLVLQLDNVKAELELAEHSLDKRSKMAVEREKELQKQIVYMQEEEWGKMRAMEADKAELEVRLEKLEKQTIETENQYRKALSNADENMALLLRQKLELEKYRIPDGQPSEQEEFEKKKLEVLELNTLVSELKRTVQELRDDNNLLKTECEATKADACASKAEVENLEVTHSQHLVQVEANWEECKQQMMERISELTAQLSKVHVKYSGDKHSNKSKLKTYRQLIVKLRNRLNLLKAKMEELETEKEIQTKNIKYEDHRIIVKQLKDLRRKTEEYRQYLLADHHPPAAVRSWRSKLAAGDQNWINATPQDFVQTEELEHVRERMIELDHLQQEQLDELEPT